MSDIPQNFRTTFKSKFKAYIDDFICDIFKKLPLYKKTKEKLYNISLNILIKDTIDSPLPKIGIVITGFGENEIYPSLVNFEIRSIFNNTLVYKTNPVVSITNKCNSAIVPFAQREMVDSFISGVSNEYNEIIGNSLRELVKQYTKIILDNIEEIDEKDKPEYTKSINNDVDNILKGIFDRVNDFRRSHYVNPILDAVNVLPKDELAAMAENLVNLTSFKRKISMEAETVGGAIDVAVISKGDGFVWINRKHYFDIKKNPHFVNNYFNKRGE